MYWTTINTAPNSSSFDLPDDHAEAEKDSAKELFGPATFLYSKTVRKLTSTR